MIKFQDNSEKKLSFAVYPLSKLVGFLIFIIILLPFIYWSLFISPVYSSLRCGRNAVGQVDCLLVERNAIALKSEKTEIKNVKDVDGVLRGLLNNKQIIIKANPEPSSFRLIGNWEKYYYPSTANTIIYFNLKSGFDHFNQRIRLSNFVRDKTDLNKIEVELKLGLITPLFILSFGFIFLGIVLNFPFKNTYDFDGEKKTLTISVKRIIFDDITKFYSLDKIEQVRFDRNDSEKNSYRNYSSAIRSRLRLSSCRV